MGTRPTTELRAARKDPEAFGRFYLEHIESLVAFITRRTFDIEVAWELAAESFARAYLKRNSFRGHTDREAAAWLFSIANREILQYQRRCSIERKALTRLGVDPPSLNSDEEARILELAELDELRTAVRIELARLNDDQREALSLRVVEELPYEEVAERLGISQQTARARVFRGLRNLANALDMSNPKTKEQLP